MYRCARGNKCKALESSFRDKVLAISSGYIIRTTYSQVTILGAGKLKDLYTQMRRVIRRSMMMMIMKKQKIIVRVHQIDISVDLS